MMIYTCVKLYRIRFAYKEISKSRSESVRKDDTYRDAMHIKILNKVHVEVMKANLL